MRSVHVRPASILLAFVCVLMLLATTVAAQTPDIGDWVYNPGTGHYYLKVGIPRTWSDAEAYAVACGGHLVTINSSGEESWLVGQFGVEYWIGMNDIAAEGTWVWSSGEAVTYINWFDGEPNDAGGIEDAGNLSDQGGVGWNDLPPGDARAFVIEAPAAVEPPYIGDPVVRVDPSNEGIWGHNWPEGAELTVTVSEDINPGDNTPIGVKWQSTTSVDGDGNFGVNTAPGCDILAGNYVIVDEPGHALTKVCLVSELRDIAVDADTDEVSGLAALGSEVEVYVFNPGGAPSVVATADVSTGVWTADFGNVGWDIWPGQDGAAVQYDDDNDATFVTWRLRSPVVKVNPATNAVWGHDWEPGVEVTVTAGDPGNPDATWTALADDNGDISIEGIVYDIQPGHLLTATGGGDTKQLLATSVLITDVDPAIDVVYGNAAPGSAVAVYIGGVSRAVIADVITGDWTADYSVPGPGPNEEQTLDILQGADVAVEQYDDDGDATHADWHVPNTHFYVGPNEDHVWGHDWLAGAEITVSIGEDAGQPDHVAYAQADENGYFDLWNLGYDVQPGELVTVTDGQTTKEHRVTGVSVAGVDPDTDTVWGTAEPGSTVIVGVHQGGSERHVVADGITGEWTADFTDPIGDEGWQQGFDIQRGNDGNARQMDDDGDNTWVHWQVPDTRFSVNPADDGVWGNEWPVGAELTITIGEVSTPDFQTTVFVNEWGDFDLWDFGYDVQAGETITVTDGVTTKTHVVTGLVLLGVDEDTDTVFGTAAPDSWVDVGIHDTGLSRWVQADGSGNWSTDFSVASGPEEWEGAFDITPGTRGYADQYDDDHDATWIDWQVPDTRFSVNPADDGVWGNEWPAGAELTLTIGEVSAPDFQMTAYPDEWGDFWADTSGFDILAGQLVTVTDGVTTKTHVVTELVVLGIDPDTDTVFGTAAPDSWVDVGIHDTGLTRWVQADGSGNWSTDFSIASGPEEWEGAFDITPGTRGYADQYDDDHDATWIDWRVPDTRFSVDPNNNGVWGNEWPAGAELTLTIGEVSAPDFQMTVYPDEWGDFWADTSEFDILAGQLVTVTDGVTTKTHVVTELVVLGMEPDTDTVFGTAAPDSWVDVGIHDTGLTRWVQADGSGNWSTDFSVASGPEWWEGTFDITPGTGGYADQPDDDNDATWINWQVPNPRFYVDPYNNSIWGNEWPAGAELTVTVGDVSAPDFQTLAYPDEWGDFWADTSGLDILAGQLVTVTDGVTTRTHVVTELVVLGMDPDTDTVFGTAAPDSWVDVGIHGEGPSRWVQANSGGAWTADFSVPGSEWWEGTFDITPGTWGYADQSDDDNDATWIDWYIPNPTFTVSPENDNVWGGEWLSDAELTIMISEASFSDTQTTVYTDEWGNFGLPDAGFGSLIQAGQLVTVTDGVTTKTHVVTELVIAGVDPDTETVFGTAEPGSEVHVYIDDEWRERWVTADPVTGDWVADFSEIVAFDEWGQPYDIGPGTGGGADQSDEDWDSTWAGWYVPNPQFQADPQENGIWGNEWPASAELTVTIGDVSAPVFQTTALADEWGEFGADMGGFDVVAGQLVTVTDGVTTKTHIVTELVVLGVDKDTDAVWGSASPDSWVNVGLHDDGTSRYVQANGLGFWTADFSVPGFEWWETPYDIGLGTAGYAEQSDDDSDATWANWYVPDPFFSVYPDGDWIESYGWPHFVELTISIDDGSATTDFLVDSGDQGMFSLDLAGFDVQPGHSVTITDGDIIETHLVTTFAITGVDAAADTVSGVASPDAWVVVHPRHDQLRPSRTVQADGNGNWTADFSAAVGSEPADQPFDIMFGTLLWGGESDDAGNATAAHWYVTPPEGWQHNPATGHDYLWVYDDEQVSSWADAEAYAVSLDGHLVTVNDAEEHDWLVETFGTEYYIGLNDIATEGEWVWASGEPVTFTAWLDGEPNDGDGWGEDAAVLACLPPIGWSDVPDNELMPFVVEVAVEDTTPPVVTLTAVPPAPNGLAGWYVTAPAITATADEPATFYYSWTSAAGPWTLWADPAVPIVAPAGTSTFYCYATDASANDSGVESRTFKVDTAAPPTPAAPYWSSITTTSVDLAWTSVTDAHSGTAYYEIRDGASVIATSSGTSYTAGGLTPGSTHTFTLAACDVAGNLSTVSPELSVEIPTTSQDGNVDPGTNVEVPITVPTEDGDVEVTVVFQEVTQPGTLVVTPLPDAPGGIPDGFHILGEGRFDVSFTGEFVGTIDISFPYDPTIPPARALRLKIMHWKDNGWVDVTLSVDTVEYVVWARVDSLSPFVVTVENQVPVAVDDTYDTDEDQQLVVPAAGVLANDTDADADGLTAIKLTDPGHGTLDLADNGGFTYTPTPGYSGSDSFTYKANDGIDDSNTATVNITVNEAPPVSATVIRIADRTRFSTAVAIAKKAYPGWAGVKHVVIASGDDRAAADPLAASGLCWAYDAPMLLVSAGRTPDEVKTAIAQIVAENDSVTLHVVGGPVSVPGGRLSELVAAGGGSSKVAIDRLLSTGGRYDMARAIALRMKSVRGGDMPSVALFANGADATKFFDALALSPIAAGTGAPILLVTADSVPGATQSAITALAPATRIAGGGPNTISNSVVAQLSATRWSGRSRYDTAIAIANGAVSKGWLTRVCVGVAAKLPDALTGGSYAGHEGGVLVLTEGTVFTPVTKSWLVTHKAQVSDVCIFGGPLSVTQGVVTAIENAVK